jgi:hypothetical protein
MRRHDAHSFRADISRERAYSDGFENFGPALDAAMDDAAIVHHDLKQLRRAEKDSATLQMKTPMASG